MNRREFIGGAAAWPLAARAQQGERARRIGVLYPADENDPLVKSRFSAFTQTLADLGWTVPRNVRMDLRWVGADADRIRASAKELVGLQPDIILTGTIPATVAVQRATRTIPIVFEGLADPVASGSGAHHLQAVAWATPLGGFFSPQFGGDGGAEPIVPRTFCSAPFSLAMSLAICC
jgi:putative ABC transport system substrate-binding protein